MTEILKDDYPVYAGYFYNCDGKPIISDISGTVKDLKKDLREFYKLEAKEITRHVSI